LHLSLAISLSHGSSLDLSLEVSQIHNRNSPQTLSPQAPWGKEGVASIYIYIYIQRNFRKKKKKYPKTTDLAQSHSSLTSKKVMTDRETKEIKDQHA
jgi:hypothetical protein